MSTPNPALFPAGLATPDIDGANPARLDPQGRVYEPREAWLRIMGAWNINNVTRHPTPQPTAPAFGAIHIQVPAALTGAEPATTDPDAIMWNGSAWVNMTPAAYQCAMIKLGLPCALSTAAGNTATIGPDGGLYVGGSPVAVVPIQTVSSPLVLTGTNVDVDFALMSNADRQALISAQAGNTLVLGADGKLYVPASTQQLRSATACNGLVNAGDGLWYPERTIHFQGSTGPVYSGTGPTSWAAATDPLVTSDYTFTITNPSACRSIQVYLSLQAAVGVIGLTPGQCSIFCRAIVLDGATVVLQTDSDSVTDDFITNGQFWGTVATNAIQVLPGATKTLTLRVQTVSSALGAVAIEYGFGRVNYIAISN